MERKCLAPALPIPNLDRAVVTGRHHGLTIGTERHALDRRRMRREHLDRLSAGHVPQAHTAIRATGCHAFDYPG